MPNSPFQPQMYRRPPWTSVHKPLKGDPVPVAAPAGRCGCGMAMKASGKIASNAVTTSIAITPCNGRTVISRAPKGGATMFNAPKSV